MSENGDPESPTARGIVASRIIDAPREKVFRAFSDPSHLAQWWGPNGFTNTFNEFDLRPGGMWRFVMHGPDGSSYPMEHLFVDVTAPERVVFKHLNTQPSDHEFEMTITFAAQGSKTVVGWRQLFDSAAEWQRIARLVVPATEQNLDRLASEVLRATPTNSA